MWGMGAGEGGADGGSVRAKERWAKGEGRGGGGWCPWVGKIRILKNLLYGLKGRTAYAHLVRWDGL